MNTSEKELFRTYIPIPKSPYGIDHGGAHLLLGSCFTEHIGSKLQRLKFPTLINPMGILYNPFSIATCLQNSLEQKVYEKKDLLEHEGLFHSLDHHGRFSHHEAPHCLEKINEELQESRDLLPMASTLLITFGTAWVYEHKETKKVIANCHKLPEKMFTRRLLSLSEIVDRYTPLLKKLQALNPNLHIIYTVSPIRHWKDGAHGNQVSKSILHLAIEELLPLSPKSSYFPSYELILDELRDYRYFAEDMLHINEIGVSYVWKRFGETYFSPETIHIIENLSKIQARLAHRPLHREEDPLFLENTRNLMHEFTKKYPHISPL